MPIANSLPALRLHSAIAAVCPIDGVSIIDPVAHAVRIDFAASATTAQRAAANAAAAAFDWSASADATGVAKTAKAAATASIDNGNLQSGVSTERIVRALAVMSLNQFNVLRAAIPRPIVSITRVGAVATATTLDPHGLQAGDSARVMGATLAPYNVLAVATVTGASTFTYPVAGTPVTPAVGSLFFAMGAIPALEPLTIAQLVAALKANIAATPE